MDRNHDVITFVSKCLYYRSKSRFDSYELTVEVSRDSTVMN